MNYPSEEFVDKIDALGAADKNNLLTSRIYVQLFSERHPQPKVLEKLKDRFERTGNVMYEKRERKKPATKNDANKMLVSFKCS